MPGFADPVHDAQRAFRQLLMALSRPGLVCDLGVALTPPEGLNGGGAIAALTLLDLDTTLWLAPELHQAAPWLTFHTGCRQSAPAQADFALLSARALPDLSQFLVGTAADPERSTTLLIQVEELTHGAAVTLRGPGILDSLTRPLPLPSAFWSWWQHNHRQFPLGVDVFLLTDAAAVGLPRSCRVDV